MDSLMQHSCCASPPLLSLSLSQSNAHYFWRARPRTCARTMMMRPHPSAADVFISVCLVVLRFLEYSISVNDIPLPLPQAAKTEHGRRLVQWPMFLIEITNTAYVSGYWATRSLSGHVSVFGEEVNVCDSYNVTKMRECCDSRLNQLRCRSYSVVSVIIYTIGLSISLVTCRFEVRCVFQTRTT